MTRSNWRLASSRRLHRVWAIALVVSISAMTRPSGVVGQPSGVDANLESIPAPALDGFEPAIQRQLSEQRAVLEETVARGDAERLELMELFGSMGELYFLYQLWEPAAACFRNAQLLAPRDFRWPYFRGVLLSRRGEPEAAIAQLEAAAELRPESAPAQIRLGRLYFETGDLERAEGAFRTALELDAAAAAAHHGLGRVAQERGELQEAIAFYERALELQPSATSIHRQLGIAYRDLGDMDKARYHVQLNQHDPVQFSDPLVFSLSGMVAGARIFIGMGNDLLANGDVEGAIAAFREAVARDPDERLAQYNLGVALLEVGDSEAALEHLVRASELDPDFRDAHFNSGRVLVEMGQFEEAAQHFRRALEIDSRDYEARLELVLALCRAGEGRAAVSELEGALTADPGNATLALALGVALVETGRPNEARTHFEQVAASAQDSAIRARAQLQLGLLLQAENQPEAALDRFQAARRLAPELVAASSAAGFQLARAGRFGEAAESFEAVVAARPRDESARFSLVMALLLAGREEEALDRLEEASESMPESLLLTHLSARVLATAEADSVRDGLRAVELAQRVFAELGNAESAETLAMAWAETGDLEEAVEWQGRAIELLPKGSSEHLVSRARKRLQLYQGGRPCRAPWKDG